MRRPDRIEDGTAEQSRAFRLCRGDADPSRCLGRDWYETCLDCIAELNAHADHHGDLSAAFAPWCKLCAAISERLNDEYSAAADDDIDYLNAGPMAKWLLRHLNRRFG
jgi:hypothetical protein